MSNPIVANCSLKVQAVKQLLARLVQPHWPGVRWRDQCDYAWPACIQISRGRQNEIR